jgi:hypothetical protein
MCSLCQNNYARDWKHIRSRGHLLNLIKLFKEHKKNNYIHYFPVKHICHTIR